MDANQQPTVQPMNFCPNCGNQITCGCQQRIASNGAQVCSSCHASYEQNLYAANQLQQLADNNPE